METIKNAVEQDYVDLMKELLNVGEYFYQASENIFTLLPLLRSAGMMSIFLEELDFHLEWKVQELGPEKRMSIFTFMINKNHFIDKDMIKVIIESGYDINDFDGHYRTPLIEALICKKSWTFIRDLIHLGACVNKVNNFNRSPLHFAYNKGIAELLLKYGAEVNVKDNVGMTPLLRALELKRNPGVIIELLKYGADSYVIDDNKNTVYHLAYFPKLIKVLHQRNLSFINLKNKYGLTPLMQAVIDNKSYYLIKALLKNDADPNCFDLNYNTPLHFVQSDTVLNMLIKYGGNVNSVNKSGEIPLVRLSDFVIFKRARWIRNLVKYTLLMGSSRCHPIINDLLEIIDDYQFTLFVTMCRGEIDKMRQYHIVHKLTFYRFCTSLKKKGKFFNISDCDLLYDSTGIEEHFPNFHYLIMMNLKKNKYRKETYFNWFKKLEYIGIETSNKKISFYFDEFNIYRLKETPAQLSESVGLANYSLYEVAKYLSRQDLINLCCAAVI